MRAKANRGDNDAGQVKQRRNAQEKLGGNDERIHPDIVAGFGDAAVTACDTQKNLDGVVVRCRLFAAREAVSRSRERLFVGL